MNVRPAVQDLDWDAWNEEHIAKHGVARNEVEEVVAGDPAVRGTYKGRLQLVGPTSAARMLTVIVGPVPNSRGRYYTFSARPASRKERRFYREQRGDIDRW